MESIKAKRSPKWTTVQIDALLTTIEAHRDSVSICIKSFFPEQAVNKS